MTSTMSVESINVDFVVNGKEHRLKCDTQNMHGNTFHPNRNKLCFRINQLPGESFKDMEAAVATTAFETVWNTGYEVLFDIKLNLVKEGHAAVIKDYSINPGRLRHLGTGMIIDAEIWDQDQEILKPFKEGKIIRVIACTQIKGNSRG